MLTKIGLPFLMWLDRALDDFREYVDNWVDLFCPCDGH